MRTGKVLFCLGIVVMVVELIFYIRTLILIPHSLMNAGVAIGSPVWQGGTLMVRLRDTGTCTTPNELDVTRILDSLFTKANSPIGHLIAPKMRKSFGRCVAFVPILRG